MALELSASPLILKECILHPSDRWNALLFWFRGAGAHVV